MRNTKIGGAAVAAIASTAMLAGCTSGGTDSGSDGPISLRMLTWTSNPDQLAVFQELADEFMADNPNVTKIDFESVTAADMPTVITTQLLAGDPPDISWLAIDDSRYFMESGVLMDLTDTLKSSDGYDFDDLIPSFYADWSDDDGLYGVPMSTSSRAMYYNADLFAAAGVPNPNEMIEAGTYDWEHFAEAAKAIADTQGRPGFVIDDSKWTGIVPLMYAYGAKPWDNGSPQTCTMDSPETIDALTLLHNMIYRDKSVPPVTTTSNFWGGEAGAISAYLSSAKLLSDASFNWGIAPTPPGPGGVTQQLGQTSFVVFKTGKHADVAADFLAYLTKKDSAEKLSQFFAPPRTSLLTAANLHAAIPTLSEEQLDPLVEATLGDSSVAPVPNTGSRANLALNEALDQFYYQPDADVAEAMASVCEKLNPALVIG
jgi:multiple sugar transport system substrate-binding protein